VSKDSVARQAAGVDVDGGLGQIDTVSGAVVEVASKSGQHRVKRTREVCFLCWSASRNAKCSMHTHSEYEGKMIRAEDSALICGNWCVRARALARVHSSIHPSIRSSTN
jgi:hypothetical protein